MSEQRYMQKGWEIDSITPVFKDDPSASQVGESVFILTAEEWAKWQALYRIAADLRSQLTTTRASCNKLDSVLDPIDGGVYDEKLGATQ